MINAKLKIHGSNVNSVTGEDKLNRVLESQITAVESIWV